MRVLFLSRWYPYPPDNGSKIRISNLLRALSEIDDVTLLSFSEAGNAGKSGNGTGPLPRQIITCPYREYNPFSWRALRGYMGITPRYLADTYSMEMDTLIRSAVRAGRYDAVVASELSMASYHCCFSGLPAVCDDIELGFYWPGTASRLPLSLSGC